MLSERTSLGSHAETILEAADALQRQDVAARIWGLDHTVWRDDPTEITNRLGWLTLNDQMQRQAPGLRKFAAEAQASGIEHVVLLAMGGSALAPEVYRATLGRAPGYPAFILLDSTMPGRVQAVTDAIDPAKTLFIVASKSGGTTEVLSYYRYFRALVEGAVEAGTVGDHFIAITDAGTILADIGRQHSFRRVFLNPSDVGGRFSGLSLFGLVPAALIGIDLSEFLNGVDAMRGLCGPQVPINENPGAWLGTVMGSLAKKGVDKLTLVTSPTLASFGLWTEQMLAESLGKDGAGIIPVANEPLSSPDAYGDDRLFVYLRLEGDENAVTDSHIEGLQAAGKPAVCLEMSDCNQLGGELFRWAFATVVAGHILGVHPFDQPNVQKAKDLTAESLRAYQSGGKLPPVEVSSSVDDLLSQVKPGDYLALLAYLPQSPQVDHALDSVRRSIQQRYHIATTAGYGPRYLHSTGQLHKGGPNSGLFLQLVQEVGEDVAVPGEPYTFGMLASAQARGDIRALQNESRRIARCQLGQDALKALNTLADSIARDAAGAQG
jgi:glucose-6-phosphate isomerase